MKEVTGKGCAAALLPSKHRIRLKRADLAAIKCAFPGYPYPNLLRAIEVSVEALEGPDQERYLDLAVFPQGQSIPERTLGALWKLDDADYPTPRNFRGSHGRGVLY
jgi:hypothetical protein